MNSLEKEIVRYSPTNYYGLVGQSKAIQEVRELIRMVAPTNASVLIRGETGTGKEIVAKALHYNHPERVNRPFVGINCVAIPEQLLESELFGYKKGAFTGANQDRIGKFEYADGGTIFLDEIGDMSYALQAKILRVLQEKQIARVGENQSKEIDVRIIAATNSNLEKLMNGEKFRMDLFYRLNVASIEIPSLRARKEDILPLAEYFIKKYSEDYNVNVNGLSKEASELFYKYHWPGNVRELESMIEFAIILKKGQSLNEPSNETIILDSKYFKIKLKSNTQYAFSENPEFDNMTFHQLKTFHRQQLLLPVIKLLENNNFNRTVVAKKLMVTRQTIRKLINEAENLGLLNSK